MAVATPLMADDAVDATWQAHQMRFHYSGFTTDYTCSGIKNKVKLLLRTLGARNDVKVSGACGGDSNRPYPFYNLMLAFAIPVPSETVPSGETFPAQWRAVTIGYNKPRDLAWGDCELVEQFRDQVLPLFPLQQLEDRTRCTPGRHNVGSPSMNLTILMPVSE